MLILEIKNTSLSLSLVPVPLQRQQRPLPADPQQWEDMSPAPRPLSTLHPPSGRRPCLLVPGLARLLTSPTPVLGLIYPPGLLECPLHCPREYPGKINNHTHTPSVCVPCIGGLGLLGMGLLACGVLGISGAWLYDDISTHVPPPPPKPSFLSLFLQQKTSGCSQPTHCYTTFRALPAWLDTCTHARTHIHSSLHVPIHFHLLFSMCPPLTLLFYYRSWWSDAVSVNWFRLNL